MKEGNELTWSQVVMAANAPVMTKAALVEGRTDVGVLPTGQVVGLIESLPSVAEIIDGVMARGRRRAAAVGLDDGRRCRPGPRPGRPEDARGGAAALRHPPQQVRHPLVGHAEEVGDARDALALGPEGDHQGPAEVPAGL